MHAVLVELAVRGGAEMIFHVARALDLVGMRRAAPELVEDRPIGLAHDIGKHVQAAAMRHADDDLADAKLAAALDDLLERRNHRFAAVEPEALGAGIFEVEEALEVSASISFLRIAFLPFAVKPICARPSMRSWIQARCSGSEMCMYSTPTCRHRCASGCRAPVAACRIRGRECRRDRWDGRSRLW